MISTTNQRVQYSGNGSNTTFAVPFRFDDDSWVKIYVNGILLTTGYALSGEGADNGGTATITTPPSAGSNNVVIIRETPLTQVENLPVNGPFPSSRVERQIADKLEMQIQDLHEIIGRAVKFLVTSTFANVALPDPEAGKTLAWNNTLDALVNVLFSGGTGTGTGGNVTVVAVSVAATAISATIPHSLNSATAKLMGWSTTWHTTLKVLSPQTVSTIPVEFGTEVPPGGGLLIAGISL
jgi:hypothetical protein